MIEMSVKITSKDFSSVVMIILISQGSFTSYDSFRIVQNIFLSILEVSKSLIIKLITAKGSLSSTVARIC